MSRPLLVGAALAILVVAGAIAAKAATRRNQTLPQPVARLEGTVVWPSGLRPAPAFALRDQNNRLISRASLRGRVWAITFLDSRCTRTCPVEAHDLGYLERLLGPRYPLDILIVSVLPAYDSPARVRAFAARAGLAGDWHWLLGTTRQLSPVWREYGIEVVSGITHTSALYLVDRRGDVRVADAIPFIPAQLAASVRALTT